MYRGPLGESTGEEARLRPLALRYDNNARNAINVRAYNSVTSNIIDNLVLIMGRSAVPIDAVC